MIITQRERELLEIVAQMIARVAPNIAREDDKKYILKELHEVLKETTSWQEEMPGSKVDRV